MSAYQVISVKLTQTTACNFKCPFFFFFFSFFLSQKVQGTNRCWVNRVQSSPCFISAATANIWIRHGLMHAHWRLLSEFKSVCAPNTTQTLLQAHSIKICCMTRYGPHLDLGVLFETFLNALCIQRNTNMNDTRLRSVRGVRAP